MELNITLKWTIGIIATVFLGALGSGLWSLVFDPLLKKLGKFLISVSSLGIKSIQNKIYCEVAKGRRDHGTRILMLIVITAITIPAMLPFVYEARSKRLDEELNRAVAIVKSQNIDVADIEDKVSEQLKIIRADRQSTAKIQILIMTLFLWFVLMFQYFRMLSIELTINNFHRCINICLPYFEENEHEIAISKFSLIKNKEDYLSVIESLEEVAKRGNLTLPS